MSKFLVILSIFAVVGVLALTLSRLLNRKPLRAIDDARRMLTDQAKEFQSQDVDRFIDECNLPPLNRHAARSILLFIAELLAVPVEKVAQNNSMQRLFAVTRSSEGSQTPTEIQPFAHDLVEGLASLSDKCRWEQKWAESPDLPRNEDAMIAFIMEMSVPQVLRFFAPLMRLN